jgi:hypothetical protein
MPMCWVCVSFRTKLYCIKHINYKARFHLHMSWVCINFSSKLYCVTEVMSHSQSFYIAITFSVMARTKEHISVEILAHHYDYTEKTVH